MKGKDHLREQFAWGGGISSEQIEAFQLFCCWMTGMFCGEAWSGAGMDALKYKASQAHICQPNPSLD